MTTEIAILGLTAATLGFVHTILGPDHYLPFIVMSRARKWSLGKTALITFLCGVGHVLTSVILGLTGVALGIALIKLEVIESFRGNVAGWLLIGFGAAYLVWGIRQAIRNRPHTHFHAHDEQTVHEHGHSHVADHAHVHDQQVASWKSLTPWVLFTIIVFGPCEPLIPIVMYPAAQHNLAGLLVVSVIFGAVTILTMLTIVLASSWGVGLVRFGRAERYVHAAAGAVVLACGLAVQFLGM